MIILIHKFTEHKWDGGCFQAFILVCIQYICEVLFLKREIIWPF